MSGKIIPSIRMEEIDWEKCWFNPGCAMSLYKPELAAPMLALLRKHFGNVKYHDICCHHAPGLPSGSTIINNCAGCDRRFRSEYAGIQTITFWELLDSVEDPELPDHTGLTVSVHDSCSFCQKPQVHAAVRNILRKMNIKIIESESSGTATVQKTDPCQKNISLVEEADMTNAEKINEFLNEAGVWYFLTTDGDQPKGRPFRFHMLKDDKIYFGTGTFKKVYQQMGKNPRVEVLAVKGGEFLRYDGTVVFESDDEMAKAVLDSAPAMKKIYNDETGRKLGMFHLENGHAEICNAMKTVEEFDV